MDAATLKSSLRTVEMGDRANIDRESPLRGGKSM